MLTLLLRLQRGSVSPTCPLLMPPALATLASRERGGSFAQLDPLCLQMARVKVAACEVHSTCGDCVGAADAYCGWCTLETR